MREKYKAGLLLAGMATIIAVAAVGVGFVFSQIYMKFGQVQPAAISEPAPEKTLELQIFEGGYGNVFWREMIRQFQTQNPDIQVIANIGYNVNEEMKINWISGDIPDVVFTDGPDFPKMLFQKEGFFKDLSPWLTELEAENGKTLEDVILPGTIQQYEGKTFILPYMLTSWGMWYNENLIDAYSSGTLPQNYGELLKLGENMKEDGIALMEYPGKYQTYLFRGIVVPSLVAAGGKKTAQQLLSGDPALFDSEIFYEYMEKLKELAEKGLLVKAPEHMTHIQAQKQWIDGEVGFIPCGMWLRNEMEPYFPADFSLKRTDGLLNDTQQMKTVRVTSSVGFAVSEKTEHEEEVKRFLAFLYSQETLQTLVSNINTPVACRIDLTQVTMEENARLMQEAFQNGTIDPVKIDFIDPKFEKNLTVRIEEYLEGQITLDDMISKLKQAD